MDVLEKRSDSTGVAIDVRTDLKDRGSSGLPLSLLIFSERRLG